MTYLKSRRLCCIILFVVLIFLTPIRSLSACDEVDVTFIVDTDSIIESGENVIDFITSIIWSGSSEYSGFSVLIYGNSIPSDIKNLNIVTLKETQNVHQRNKEEEIIVDILEKAFDKIENAANIGIDYHQEMRDNVKILDAFKIATEQNGEQHQHRKKEIFGDKYSENNIGSHDDDKIYFIFDYYNKLITSISDEIEIENINHDICHLFSHFKNKNEQSIHFIMGHKIELIEILCNGENIDKSFMKQNTFFTLTETFLEDTKSMESIFDITCPAFIDSKEFNGQINLGNHNQWIDFDTIISCHLKYINHDNDISTPNQLDPKQSYLMVKDYVNDDNTFKINDYLIADPKTSKYLELIGCSTSVMKIIKIVPHDNDKMNKKHNKKQHENEELEAYKVMKIFVGLPQSPMEYISEAHVEGDIPVTMPTQHQDKKNNKRLLLNSGDEPQGNRVKQHQGRNEKLMSLTWKNEYEWKKEGVATVNLGGGWFSGGPEITITGTGVITIKVGYGLSIDVYLYFKFDWQILAGNIFIDFKIHGHWEIAAWFNAKLTGTVEAAIKSLLKWGQTFTFAIGPVPVIIKPYIQLNAKLKSVPISIEAGIRCSYREKFELGYHYDKKKTVHPKYTLLKTNREYTLWRKYTYTSVRSLTRCAELMYLHGWGQGRSCKWFDYNRNNQECRCRGSSSTLGGYVQYAHGTNIYVLGQECSTDYNTHCATCQSGEIAVEAVGGSKEECDVSRFNFVSNYNHWQCRPCWAVQSTVDENIDKYPIRTREVESNGCTKTFGVNSNENEECPVQKLGFDVIIEPQIGVSLYVIINVFLRFEFVFPFRITVPEMDSSVCGSHGGSRSNNVCSATYLKASFTIEALLNLYIGIGLDIGKLGGILKSLFNGGSVGDNELSLPIKVGTFTIMPKTSLGCMDLSGFLQPLNTFFKSKCCARSGNRRFSARISDDSMNKQISEYYGDDYYDYYISLLRNRKQRLKMKLLRDFEK